MVMAVGWRLTGVGVLYIAEGLKGGMRVWGGLWGRLVNVSSWGGDGDCVGCG